MKALANTKWKRILLDLTCRNECWRLIDIKSSPWIVTLTRLKRQWQCSLGHVRFGCALPGTGVYFYASSSQEAKRKARMLFNARDEKSKRWSEDHHKGGANHAV